MVAWPHANTAVARLGPDTAPPPPGADVSRGRTSALAVREALLRAARELLDERGPSGLAIRDIAARAGVAPMGVYNRFGSKDGILNALLEQGFYRARGCGHRPTRYRCSPRRDHRRNGRLPRLRAGQPRDVPIDVRPTDRRIRERVSR
ncbi:hypothetical protein GCM10010182_63390 [Actinomadura cremea]|nr:hypothetical protein GCM10010182_63390 [Actinomadura cremea]